jgi:type VI secretion system FHA domain protein
VTPDLPAQRLLLRVVSAPVGQNVPPPLALANTLINIGRGNTNHWVLPDTTSMVSRQHCRIENIAGQWQLIDMSTNGTIINDALLARGAGAPLKPGDRLKIGEYVVDVEDAGGFGAGTPIATSAGDLSSDVFGVGDMAGPGVGPPLAHVPITPQIGPDAGDLFGELGNAAPSGAAPSRGPREDLFGGPMPQSGAQGSPARPAMPFGSPFDNRGRMPQMPSNQPAGFGHSDPWVQANAMPDLDASVAPPAPDGVAIPLPQPMVGGESQGLPANWMDEDSGIRSAPAAPATPAMPAARPAPRSGGTVAGRKAAPQALPMEPAASGPPPIASAISGDAALDAFLQGSGLGTLPPGVDPAAAMRMLGESTRLLAGTLSRLLAARRALKSEFRITQTVIGAQENNPLKFSVDESEILFALMGVARQGFVTGPRAVTDACRDLETHQLSLLAGLRAALDLIFLRLAPENVTRGEEPALLARMVPQAGKARLWERYQQAYTNLRRDAGENFTGAIGQAFAEAYEEAGAKHGRG